MPTRFFGLWHCVPFVLAGGAANVCAQTPLLLRTFDPAAATNGPVAGTGREGSRIRISPTPLATLGGLALFAGTDARGTELWRTDGTAEGTEIVRDLRRGPRGSHPANLTVMNGVLYFTADDGRTGTELWRSDATDTGTWRVADVNPGRGGSTPGQLTVAGGRLYFVADDGTRGRELWSTDGTPEATAIVRDLGPGDAGSTILALAGVGERLFFSADDGVSGRELWSTDGTASGTVLVKDIQAGQQGSRPDGFAVARGHLYFSASVGAAGRELWSSDGTAKGTVLVRDIRPGPEGSAPSRLTASAGLVYFGVDDGRAGPALWRTDGSAEGTVLVADLASGPTASVTRIVASGGYLYLTATGERQGDRLWTSDGTDSGTHLVDGPDVVDRASLTDVNGRLLFGARDAVAGLAPRVMDGGGSRPLDGDTGASTWPPSAALAFAPVGAGLLVAATNGLGALQLWIVAGDAPTADAGAGTTVTAAATATTRNRFWVGGSGTWSSSDTTHWAASSGGPGGQSAPGASDVVTFDAGSGGGVVTLAPGCDPAVVSISMGSFGGALDLNGNTVTLATFSVSGTAPRTLDMTNATVILTGAGTVWNASSVTGLTLTAAGSRIDVVDASPSTKTFVGNSLTYADVNFKGAGTGGYTFSGAGTYRDITVSNNGLGNAFSLSGGDKAVRSLDFTGFRGRLTNSGRIRALLGDLTYGSGMTSDATGSITLSGTSLQRITTNGVSLGNKLIVNGPSASVQLRDGLATAGELSLAEGILDANDQSVTVGSFSSSSSRARTLVMGSGTWTITGHDTTVWNTALSTRLTLRRGAPVEFAYGGGLGTRTIVGSLTEHTAIDVAVTAGNDLLAVTQWVRDLDFWRPPGFGGELSRLSATISGNLTFSPGMRLPVSSDPIALGTGFVGSNEWEGGVTGPDARIYGIPRNRPDILVLDPTAGTAAVVALTGADLSGPDKWEGGVLAPNGRIYGIPRDSPDILVIDAAAGVASRATMGANLGGADKWHGGVLGPDGKIYGIPHDAADILVIDPGAGTATRSSMGADLSGPHKWDMGVLGPDGRIYGIPRDSPDILVIDPSAGTAVRTSMGLDLSDGSKWRGGVLGPDGKIYGIPSSAAQVLVIDPAAGSASRSSMGADLSGARKWRAGTVGPDGRIYAIPADATDILKIDPVAGVASRSAMGADLVGTDKWHDGVLGSDGRIYGIPSNVADVLVVDAAAGEAYRRSMTAASAGTRTIRTNGQTLRVPVVIDGTGGTWRLADALSMSTALRLNAGRLETGGQDVALDSFRSSNPSARSVDLGSSRLTLTGSGSVWDVADSTGMSLDAGTSELVLTDPLPAVKAIAGGGLGYFDVTAQAGVDVVVTGSNQFHRVGVAAGGTLRFGQGTTQALSEMSAIGTSDAPATIRSDGSGPHRLVKVGGGTVQGEHLVISGSSVLPEGTWYAGDGSVDGGGNSGWIFSAPLDVIFASVNGGAGSVGFAPPGDSCASGGGPCHHTYAGSTSVTLTATPSAGSVFTGWGGDCSGTGTCTLSMAAARSVTAGFAVAQLFAGSTSVLEGNSGIANASIGVALYPALPVTVTVAYTTSSGTATAGSDYTTSSGTLTFLPGQTVAFVTVPIVGDLRYENDESFNFDLSSPTNATIVTGHATGTIQNDEPLPTLSVSDVTVAEGTGGTPTASLNVTLSGVSDLTVTVAYATGNGSAVAPGDYSAKSGTLTLAPGKTSKAVVVAVVSDNRFEGEENFALFLSSPTNASVADDKGVATIVDDDPAPVLSIGDSSVTEPDAGTVNATFAVTLSNPSDRAITVTYTTLPGTATAGSDYTARSGTVTFKPGQTSRSVVIPVKGDVLAEADESFTVDLSDPVNATIADARGLGTIVDDD